MPIGMDNHRKLGGSNGDSVQLDSTVGGRIGHYEHEFKKVLFVFVTSLKLVNYSSTLLSGTRFS